MYDDLSDELKSVIRTGAAGFAERYGKPAPPATRMIKAQVAKVNADGTLDLTYQGAELMGVAATTACAGAGPGDTVVCESFQAQLIATGVIRTQAAQPYRLLWTGKLTSVGQVATIPDGGLYTLFALRYSDWTTGLIGLRTPSRNDHTSDRFVRFFGAYDSSKYHEMYIASFNMDETCTKWTYAGGCIDQFDGTASGLAGDMRIYGIF